ncbi:cell division protein FtsW, partial [Helicobacter pylori]
LGGVRICLA